LKVFPIAYDSFGVRSMATYVKAGKTKIFIDPGVALAPKRYGLPPTKPELYALAQSRENIMKIASKCDVVIVTHYHYDHHPYPDDDEMYASCFFGKKVLAKDISKNINLSGKKRGSIFKKKLEGKADLLFVDGKKLEYDGTLLHFSPAVWHGEVKSKVGKVIMVCIERSKKRILFGSDAQSLADPEALKWVLSKDPHFLIIDGYPTIFIGWRMKKSAFERAKENLKKAVSQTSAKTIILDHHILRDINYKEKIADVYDAAKKVHKKILSAAEYYGLKNLFLEAWRKKIHQRTLDLDVKSYYLRLRKIFNEI